MERNKLLEHLLESGGDIRFLEVRNGHARVVLLKDASRHVPADGTPVTTVDLDDIRLSRKAVAEILREDAARPVRERWLEPLPERDMRITCLSARLRGRLFPADCERYRLSLAGRDRVMRNPAAPFVTD